MKPYDLSFLDEDETKKAIVDKAVEETVKLLTDNFLIAWKKINSK